MATKEFSQNYTVPQAFRYCMEVARRHYENFPVASLAIPRKLRPPIAAIYAFARAADDFADEEEFADNRMARLTEWEEQLKTLSTRKPEHPVFIALHETLQQFDIPMTLFTDLIRAFKMDVIVSRYENFGGVLNYCRFSANPIGRIILHLFGYPAPKFLEYSDSICTALQLTNFWQDIAVDLKKNRIYLPQEEMSRFGYSEADLKNKIFNENFKRLLLFQIDRTIELFEKGKELCGKIPGRLGFELRLTWLGGMRILEKIREADTNVLINRPILAKKDYRRLIAKALFKRKPFL